MTNEEQTKTKFENWAPVPLPVVCIKMTSTFCSKNLSDLICLEQTGFYLNMKSKHRSPNLLFVNIGYTQATPLHKSGCICIHNVKLFETFQ